MIILNAVGIRQSPVLDSQVFLDVLDKQVHPDVIEVFV